jgi:hypothetical protein
MHFTKVLQAYVSPLPPKRKVEASANANRLRKLPKLAERGCEKFSDREGGSAWGRNALSDMNLLMCDGRGTLYSGHASVS